MNISHQKNLLLGDIKVQPETTPILLITFDTKSNKEVVGFTEVQFLRNPILATSDIYEKQLAFFENVKPEEFLISVRDFQNNIKMT